MKSVSFRHLLASLFAALVLAAAAPTLAQDEPQPPALPEEGGRWLQGDELRARIADTTWYGYHGNANVMGSPWFEYQAPDGNSVLVEVSGTHYGVWEVQGDAVCYCYERIEGIHCFRVMDFGSTLAVVTADDGQVSSIINGVRPGNPQALQTKDLSGKAAICPGMV